MDAETADGNRRQVLLWCSQLQLRLSAKQLLNQTLVQPPPLLLTVTECLADSAVCCLAGQREGHISDVFASQVMNKDATT